MSKRADDNGQNAPEHIDQIRDIIFGAQKREYDRRFEKISSELSSFRQELLKHIDEVKESLTSDIHASVSTVEQKISLLTTTTQEELGNLRKQLEQADTKWSKNLQAIARETTDAQSALRTEFSNTLDKLQKEIRSLKDQVYRDLERQFSDLKEVTVSRESLSELLFELGMKMKGVEMVAELQKAARNKEASRG